MRHCKLGAEFEYNLEVSTKAANVVPECDEKSIIESNLIILTICTNE